MITVTGGKLTTYRSMAAEVVDEVVSVLERVDPDADRRDDSEDTAESTSEEPLPGQDRDVGVRKLAALDPELAREIVHGLPYTFADVEFAASHEMAVTIADVLIRRTHVAFETRDNGMGVAGDVARVMSRVLGWSTDEASAQVEIYAAEVRRVFAVSALHG